MWLNGPAGTGKSAVAQTFAERCVEQRRLGAAFFFSGSNDRDDPKRVIPTLAYQLAVCSAEYKALLTERIVNDPTILQKAARVQLRSLIVEPFSILQMQGHQVAREPLLILLDGLDECDGIDAQCGIVEMIGEVVRLKKDLPLLWLICSRPEAHLKSVFSGPDFSIECGREELIIDDQCRDDVDRYLRDELATIKARFREVTTSSWPSGEQFSELSDGASGLFALASTSLKFISDPIAANPVEQLDILVSFLKRMGKVGSRNPLVALDLLYVRILSGIPEEVFPTTWRILSHLIHANVITAQSLCNFLNLNRNAFYGALHKLHSVIDVPTPEEASERCLRFYHTSFQDFLLDANRSGRFAIEKERAWVDVARSCLFWCKIDVALFHTTDGECTAMGGSDGSNFFYSTLDWPSRNQHEHGNLPGLKWVSPDDAQAISRSVATSSGAGLWRSWSHITEAEPDLLGHLRDYDFRWIPGAEWFLGFADWLHRQVGLSVILSYCFPVFISLWSCRAPQPTSCAQNRTTK